MTSNMFKCLVTHIIDPHNIWCHIGTDSSFESFSKFEEHIHHFAREEIDKAYQIDINSLRSGKSVLAYCSKRRQWMRAVINGVNSDEEEIEVDVLFPDYQYSEMVTISNVIADVPDWVISCEPQAVRCSLVGVKPIAATWVPRTLTFLQNKLLFEKVDAQCVHIKINHNVSVYMVDILIQTDSGAQSVSELLIDQGLAIHRPPDGKVPKFNIDKLTLHPSARTVNNSASNDRDYEREIFCAGEDADIVDFQNLDLKKDNGSSETVEASENIYKMIEEMKNSTSLRGDHNSPLGRGIGRGRRKYFPETTESSPEAAVARSASPSGACYNSSPDTGDIYRDRRGSGDGWRDGRRRENRTAENYRNSHHPEAKKLPPRLQRLQGQRERSHSSERGNGRRANRQDVYYQNDRGYQDYDRNRDYNKQDKNWNNSHNAFVSSVESDTSLRNTGGDYRTDSRNFRENKEHRNVSGNRIDSRSNDSNNFRQNKSDSRNWDPTPGANRKRNSDERSGRGSNETSGDSSDKNWRSKDPAEVCADDATSSAKLDSNTVIETNTQTDVAEIKVEYNMWSDPQENEPTRRWSDWHEGTEGTSQMHGDWQQDKVDNTKVKRSTDGVDENCDAERVDWNEGNIETKVNRILAETTEDNVADSIRDIHAFISPDKGGADLRSCIEAVAHWAIDNRSMQIPVHVIKSFSQDNEELSDVIGAVIQSLQKTYVKVSSKGKKTYEVYVEFLAYIYMHAQHWQHHDSVIATVVSTVANWAVFNKHKQHTRPGPLYDLYADCLYAFLYVAGQHMEDFRSQDMVAILADVRDKVVTADMPQGVREKYLSIIEEHNDRIVKIKDETIATLEQNRTNTPQQPVKSATADFGIQTRVSTRDTGSDPMAQVDTSRVGRSEVKSDNDGPDPYIRVKEMLQDLNLKSLLCIFEENGVRDSVLELDWTDLKGLLKECGVKAGQVLEFRNYLTNSKSGRCPSPLESFPSVHSSSSFYSTKDDVSKSPKQQLAPANENQSYNTNSSIKFKSSRRPSADQKQDYKEPPVRRDLPDRRISVPASHSQRIVDSRKRSGSSGVVPVRQFQHPEIPLETFQPSVRSGRSSSAGHEAQTRPVSDQTRPVSDQYIQMPYNSLPTEYEQHPNSRTQKRLFTPNDSAASKVRKTKQQAMLEDSFAPPYVLKQLSGRSEDKHQHASSRIDKEPLFVGASRTSPNYESYDVQAVNHAPDDCQSLEYFSQPAVSHRVHHSEGDLNNYHESSGIDGTEQRRSSEAGDSPNDSRPRKYNADGFKNIVNDWLSRTPNELSSPPTPVSPNTSHDNRPSFSQANTDSQRHDCVNQRSYFPPPPPVGRSVRLHNVSRENVRLREISRDNTRVAPCETPNEEDTTDDAPNYTCNPVEYPSLSEASAVLKKTKCSEPESPRTMIAKYQQQYRAKYNIPDYSQTKATSNWLGTSARVCTWCGSVEHHPDSCPDKSKNLFF